MVSFLKSIFAYGSLTGFPFCSYKNNLKNYNLKIRRNSEKQHLFPKTKVEKYCFFFYVPEELFLVLGSGGITKAL
jgi:hypothetical protein